MYNKILKIATCCALALTLAACQKEKSAFQNTPNVKQTTKTAVTFDVSYGTDSRALDLTGAFTPSIDSIIQNGFYLYVANYNGDKVFVKMLYRTIEGETFTNDSTMNPLKWYPYSVGADGTVNDNKANRTSFYNEDLYDAYISAIYVGNRTITKSEYTEGIVVDVAKEPSSFADFDQTLYATTSDIKTISVTLYGNKVTIQFKPLMSTVTVEPLQNHFNDLKSIALLGTATSCTLHLAEECERNAPFNSYITADESSIHSIAMYKTSSYNSLNADTTVKAKTLFVCAIPPQITTQSTYLELTTNNIASKQKLQISEFSPNGINYFKIMSNW